MRIPFDALRLCALVAAGAASGYLWRAAFESTTPEVRVAGTPRAVHPAPAPKVVRIPPARVAPHKAVAHHVARRSGTRHVAPASTQLASHPVTVAPVATPAPQPSTPEPSSPPPTPKPKPQPKPAPTPPPAPVTSPPAPSPSPPTPTVQAAAPPPQPTQSPQQPQQPVNQPNLGNSTSDVRPGWGKGDKNHTHTGP